MPSIDVLIPHYNSPAELDVSLQSLAQQVGAFQLRVVVVDDGSNAPQRKAARALTDATELSTLFFENSSNRGRPYTRNRLLDAVDSEFVTWLDAGDIWYPQKTAEQLDRYTISAMNGAQPWVTCDYHWHQAGRAPRLLIQDLDNDPLKALLLGDTLRAYLWTALMPTSTLRKLGPFDERLPRLQDLDYFVRFVASGGTLVKPGHALCAYYKSDVGRNAREIYRCQRYLLDKHRTLYARYGTSFHRICAAKGAFNAARFAWNNRDYAAFVSYMMSALGRAPLHTLGRLF